MRLLVRTPIYRAFPELDSFSDERCRRFVKVAARPMWFRVQLGVASLLTFVLGVCLPTVPFSFLENRAPLVLLFLAGASLLVAAVAAMVVRDQLLRRRVRSVLRARGRCHSCGYILAGASVSDANEVVCPECGFTTSVDPALGELATDSLGRAHYQPSTDSLHAGPRWLTPARRQRLRRWGPRLVVSLCVSLVVGVAAYEVFLRVQASAARAIRPGRAGIRAFQLAHEPAGLDPDSPNSWDAFGSVYAKFLSVEAAAIAALLKDGQGQSKDIDYPSIYADPSEAVTDQKAAELLSSRQDALVALAGLEASGFFDDARAMVNRPRHLWFHDWPSTQPSWALLLPQLGEARRMARALAARMALAAERQDPAASGVALETLLGLSRMLKTQPTVIEWLVGQAVESLALGRALDSIQHRPSLAWIDGIEPLLWQHLDSRTPFASALEGDRLLSRDSIGWIFEDPSRVRLGRFSKAVRELVGEDANFDKRLGTLWENTSAIDQQTTRFLAAAQIHPWQRDLHPIPPDSTGLILLPWFVGSSEKQLRQMDHGDLQLAALLVMLRIERYRLVHGDYPASLALAQADSPRPFPVDSFSGKPFTYLPVSPAADPFGRGFILYSVGQDKIDNQGMPPPAPINSPFEAPHGTDYIINDPRR